MEPIFIAKAARPRCFNKHSGSQLGFTGYWNKKTSWMTGVIFVEWLSRWDKALLKDKRKILLLLDNFSGHKIDTSNLTSIRLEFFQANLTAHVQPLDGGIIQTLVKKAWHSITSRTIANCWRHVGILPPLPTSSEPSTSTLPATATTTNGNPAEVAAAERETAALLDRFYQTNAVSSSVRMSIAELLNPVQEQVVFSAATPSAASEVEGNNVERSAEPESELDAEEEDEDVVVVAPSALKAYGMASSLNDFSDSQVDPFFKDFARMLRLAKPKITLERRVAMAQPTIASCFSSMSSFQ
ncbi:unnamed protein product [Tilletia controversa]|uniref:DDE-1 domain-containing protein n=1 Tax=Tilletia controversa TaxID=13291 RepID=A0A8X7SUJ1_9BASI|nr:hypothetical protein CF328_g5333 [Tilletia controversa]KAE8242840.1 hypothetical protein A4X06_0g6732 [Tilletia controversa]CAD6899442.1 unnamed protein product [Tilletia controversa]CAD6951746.1 unnamed protein product [Tilletia controversa]CAD6981775.1 unnamed protein product [Tilletia controversa]